MIERVILRFTAVVSLFIIATLSAQADNGSYSTAIPIVVPCNSSISNCSHLPAC